MSANRSSEPIGTSRQQLKPGTGTQHGRGINSLQQQDQEQEGSGIPVPLRGRIMSGGQGVQTSRPTSRLRPYDVQGRPTPASVHPRALPQPPRLTAATGIPRTPEAWYRKPIFNPSLQKSTIPTAAERGKKVNRPHHEPVMESNTPPQPQVQAQAKQTTTPAAGAAATTITPVSVSRESRLPIKITGGEAKVELKKVGDHKSTSPIAPSSSASQELQLKPQQVELREEDESQKETNVPVLKKDSEPSAVSEGKYLSASRKEKKEKSFDFCEYFGIEDKPEPEKPYNFEEHGELMPLLGEKVLCVHNWITFYPCTTSAVPGCFNGTLHIRNTSHVNMAYILKCSKPNMLMISEPTGYLNPQERKKIAVSTNPQGNYNFLQLRTAAFLVLGIPVYFRKQLAPDKIELLWQAFENGIIPQCDVEMHQVRFMKPGDRSMTKELSVLNMLGFGNLAPWPWNNTRLTESGHDEGDDANTSLTLDEFYTAWNCESGEKQALLSEFINVQLKMMIAKAAARDKNLKRKRRVQRWISISAYMMMVIGFVFAGPKFFSPPFLIQLSGTEETEDQDQIDSNSIVVGGWRNWMMGHGTK